MATDTPQGHVLAPTATGLPLDVLVMDDSQGHVHLGSTATGLPLDALVMHVSQGHIHLDSTATDSSLDELVAAQGHLHLGPTLTDFPPDPLVTNTSQGHDFPGSTAAGFPLDELVTDTSQGHVRPGSTASDSSLDGPTTRDFRQWKKSWDKKMLLVRLKREGRDWEYIIKVFWRMDKKSMEQSGWTSMWQRSAHDVGLGLLRRLKLNERANPWAMQQIDVLGRAARADRESEVDRLGDLMSHHSMVDAAWIDYEGIWDRISELMNTYGTEFKWTPERVKYAWTHGVSNMFPDIVLRQRQFSRHISTDFVHTWTANVLDWNL
jgi:hypothetical protein